MPPSNKVTMWESFEVVHLARVWREVVNDCRQFARLVPTGYSVDVDVVFGTGLSEVTGLIVVGLLFISVSMQLQIDVFLGQTKLVDV